MEYSTPQRPCYKTEQWIDEIHPKNLTKTFKLFAWLPPSPPETPPKTKKGQKKHYGHRSLDKTVV